MIRKSIRPSMLSLKVVHNLYMNKEGITIKDLAKNIKTDYKNVHDSVGVLFKEGAVKKEKIGNYNICKLNYDNEDIVEYLKEYNFYIKVREFKTKYSVEYGIIMDAIEHRKYPELFVCLVFGSYAKNEEKMGSDLDILFINRTVGIIHKTELDMANLPYQRKFHVTEQSMLSFIKDLRNKEKISVANEVYKHPPIVFYGDDVFFRMVMSL